jgi:hypothetical protein
MTPSLPEKSDGSLTEQHLDQLLAVWPTSRPSAPLRSAILYLSVATTQSKEPFMWWLVTSWWQPTATEETDPLE